MIIRACLTMEITTVSPQSIRIKGKHVAFVANPLEIKSKTTADAVLLFKKGKPDLSKVDEYRLVVEGAGDYEFSGAKVETLQSDSNLAYFIEVDGGGLFVTSASFLSNKPKGVERECPAVVVYCDGALDGGILTELSPRALVLYGPQAAEVLKSIGKEVEKTSKVVISPEKLPEEMQAYLLS